MTALCTQLLGQSGGLGGLYLPTSQQPAYAARFDGDNPSDNLALGGAPALVFGAPPVTPGSVGVLPALTLQSLAAPKRYIDTGVLDTASLTILMIAKIAVFNAGGEWSSTPVLCSNFNLNELGTFQFVQANGGVELTVSTATTGLNNITTGAPLTAAQATAYGLYSARVQTDATATTLQVRALTAGTVATISSAPRYISPSVKTLQIGATPGAIFGAQVSISDPLIFQYALTDDELSAAAQILRARAEQFGVTV